MNKGQFRSVEYLHMIIGFADLGNKDSRKIGVMSVKSCLSKNLRKLLKDKGLSAKSLSKSIGIPSSTISSYLAGKKATYSPEHLAALSQYFGVTVDFLLFGNSPDVSSLNSLQTEGVFEGWLKVKIERAIPSSGSRKEGEE